ncbi:TPA: IS3 family transposase [Pasteurella multocida]|nr:IS3 family transposase [Pasteurella multocida]
MHYYNNGRIQVRLKGLSPVEYRTQSLCLMSLTFWGQIKIYRTFRLINRKSQR